MKMYMHAITVEAYRKVKKSSTQLFKEYKLLGLDGHTYEHRIVGVET